ncbi:hypothetical protein [Pseudobutyrivibrio xylanivorans]|uniref:DUF4367 domain-containing protein n=1 Tax=Pseudobutyrivibrio xylanivorans TaxID=185007 RepID=A0A5P6VTP0_PSEXY|nr:hypothetical protein [Pseudobutyrivibrio xylanivorans]QFJ55993.1 hypothetical protein FXF36_14380 [Pseudobutyrivibrio xylanivorans]
MSKKYDEVMDRISLSDESRERIMNNIKKFGDDSNIIRFTNWKKYTAIAAALAVVVVGGSVIYMQSNVSKQMDGSTYLLDSAYESATEEAAEPDVAGGTKGAPSNDGAFKTEEATEGEYDISTTIANPIVEYNSLKELCDAAGFEIKELDNLPFKITSTSYTLIAGETAQIIYYGEGDNEICYRKALGSEDISGDYNTYNYQDTLEVNGNTITLKGTEANLFNLALWQDSTYTYSLYVTPNCSRDVYENMISSIVE